MRLITLNLRHGGGRHAPALLAGLLALEGDVLVLTEHRNNPVGERLRTGLAAAGLVHQAVSHAAPRANAILVAAREPFRPLLRPALGFDRARLFSARFAAFELIAVHLPNLAAKVPHWEALLRLPHRRRPRVLAGDFNTGRHPADAPGYRFRCAEHMARLEAKGWVDAWRRLHPDGREFSWYSHRGRGFRLDHVFLSPPLAPALRGAAFAHGVRERGFSDHSALVVELAL